MIALQVVRTSFGFYLRECMGSCFPPPPPPCPNLTEHQKWVAILVFQSSLEEISSSAIKTKIPHLVNIHRLISFDI